LLPDGKTASDSAIPGDGRHRTRPVQELYSPFGLKTANSSCDGRPLRPQTATGQYRKPYNEAAL